MDGASGPFREPSDDFRKLAPSEQQLSCFCALFGGEKADALAEHMPASKVDRMRKAILAVLQLDSRSRLKVFSRCVSALPPQHRCSSTRPRLAAVLALAHPGRDPLPFSGMESLLDEAKAAHPALRTYAVRSRTSR